MSENAFESLAKSLNELSETIETNADAITENIRKKKQAQQLAGGKITAEEAFSQDVQFARGEMLDLYCTHCGEKIRMHEKVSSAICRICGHEVQFADAKSGKFESSALSRMNGKLLYKLAGEKKYHRDELLRAAATHGNVEANRDLALKAVTEQNFEEALKYAQVGEKHVDPDCRCCVIVCKIGLEKYSDAEDALSALRKIKRDSLKTEKGKELYDLAIKTTEEFIRKKREAEEERRRATSIYVPSYSSSTYSYTPTPTLESTIWSDWRTGEPLYRNSDGKIVNGSGEEVSVAWWD